MDVNELIDRLVQLGASPEIIKVSVSACIEARGLDDKKANRQARNRRYYESHKTPRPVLQDVLQDVLQTTESVLKTSETPSRAPAFSIGEGVIDSPYEKATPSLPPQKTKTPRAKSKRQIQEDEQPTEKDKSYAAKAGLGAPEFREQWRKFRNHHVTKGNVYASWQAAWRTWVDGIAEFQRPHARVNGHKGGVIEALGRIHSEFSDEAPSPSHLRSEDRGGAGETFDRVLSKR